MADPIPELVFYDTFTDGDGTLIGDHTPDVGVGYTEILNDVDLEVNGNKLTAGVGSVSVEWVADATNADAVIEAKTNILVGNAAGSSIIFRSLYGTTDPRSRWVFGMADSYVYIYCRVDDVNTLNYTNYSTGDNTGAEHTLRVELDGDIIKCFHDDVEYFNIEDDTLNLGRYHGFRFFNVGGTVDDFSITAVPY